MVQLIGSFHISSNKLASKNCNTWLEIAAPSTFPSSTCIDLLRGDSCMLHMGVIHICYMCSSHVSYKASESFHDRNVLLFFRSFVFVQLYITLKGTG